MGKLEKKIVIVTGGSGLLGRVMVDKIRSEGAVCINADIRKHSEDSNFSKCDVTDEGSIKNTVASVIQEFGKIDGLVNNAYPRTSDWGAKFEDIEVESWRKNIDMQLNSCFIFSKAVVEQMVKQQSGSIINIGSQYGITAPDFSVYEGTSMTSPAAYSAIKGGIIHFTKYMASYFGKYNVRANCISPGGIFDNQNPVFVSNYERKVPMKRMGTASDIAGPVSFLLSDEAAYITGHNLVVDGGWTVI